MSTSATSPNASAPAIDQADTADLQGVVQAITAAVPGVVQSLMVIVNVHDGNVSGVVLDPDEPGGGYVAEQELAPGVAYLVVGVGRLGVANHPAGVHILNDWLPASDPE